MEERILDEENFDIIKVKTKRGNILYLSNLLYDRYYNYFILGLVSGMIIFLTMNMILPTNINSIANQLCNNYNGYLISFKYNSLNSNFDSLICKINYEFINLIH